MCCKVARSRCGGGKRGGCEAARRGARVSCTGGRAEIEVCGAGVLVGTFNRKKGSQKEAVL